MLQATLGQKKPVGVNQRPWLLFYSARQAGRLRYESARIDPRAWNTGYEKFRWAHILALSELRSGGEGA